VLVSLEDRFSREKETHRELLYAADASLLAVRKALAGLDYLEWRRRPASLSSIQRGRLSQRLATLASEQTSLGRTLWRLWQERNHRSNFEITKKKLAVSIRSLRGAARRLANNRPRPIPEGK
jgi:hypothetical protein